MELIIQFKNLTIAMAPWLLVGLMAAGIIHVFLPQKLIASYLGGNSFKSILRAAILGIPLPVCSCGVLPLATEIRNAGASKPSTLSFLITTPVTGADSLAATWSILGWPMMIIRLVISVFAGILSGTIYFIFPDKNIITQGNTKIEPVSCTTDNCTTKAQSESMSAKIKSALSYAFIELPSSMSSSLLIGLLIGALISALLPQNSMMSWLTSGITGILIATAFAVPMYVCATGSIPIAAAMIIRGFSPGAALAFLICGPATNTVAITTIKKMIGTRALFIYLFTIILAGLGSGIILNVFFPGFAGTLKTTAIMSHPEDFSLIANLSGLFLFSVLLYHQSKDLLLKLRSKTMTNSTTYNLKLNVSDMTCRHCEATISKTLLSVDDISDFRINLPKKTIDILKTDILQTDEIIQLLKTVGYTAKEIQ